MVVMNDLDRYHLLMDAVERLPKIADRAAELKQAMRDKLAEHKRYIAEHGDDMPEIRNWKWET
jgi:xylulose-5-phosphate/fructose-6-phosphate phosphoketolase